jgi:hypothetical protein
MTRTEREKERDRKKNSSIAKWIKVPLFPACAFNVCFPAHSVFYGKSSSGLEQAPTVLAAFTRFPLNQNTIDRKENNN